MSSTLLVLAVALLALSQGGKSASGAASETKLPAAPPPPQTNAGSVVTAVAGAVASAIDAYRQYMQKE
jgi:hypothetical protein